MALRTGNPALNAKTFGNLTYAGEQTGAMTLDGTVNKTGILLILLTTSAVFVWHIYMSAVENQAASGLVSIMMFGGLAGGFILALATVFRKTWSPVTAPLYAVMEGLFLGGISAAFESAYPGIVIQAVGLTFGTLFILLFAYKSRLIKATENFKLGVVAATGGAPDRASMTSPTNFFAA